MTNTTNQGILNPGDLLNNTYVISELIASGGTGEVYRATNRVSGREIAIKILKAEFAQDEQFTDLMKREASVLHEVIDDCVVRYYDLLESDMHDGFLFIVMEFIHGHSLAENMNENGPLAADVLLQVAERVLLGLKAAHAKNAFHPDLSPDNILLRNREPKKATLIDFGIAKDVNEGAKTVIGGGFAGKYQYAAPEQMEGKADARSDLYSLGMTLVGAFRGENPSAGSSLMEIISAKASKPDISDMEGQLYDLVSRLVEPDPTNRFQSAAEALGFLKNAKSAMDAPLMGEETVIMPRGTSQPQPTTPPAAEKTIESLQQELEEPKKSKTGLIATFLVLLVLTAGGGAWMSGLFNPSEISKPTEVTEDINPSEVSKPTEVTEDINPSEISKPTEMTEDINPTLPLADPYILNIERISKSEPLTLRGNLPSEKDIKRITTTLKEKLDTISVSAEVLPADGLPFEDWVERIVEIALNFDQLEAWKVSASGKTVTLTGKTESAAEKTALIDAIRVVISGTELIIEDQLVIAIPPVDMDELTAALQSLSTCGPLDLIGGTSGIISATDNISVFGMLANATDVPPIQAFLAKNAPGRPVKTALTVLNNGVCSALQILPTVPSNKLRLKYSDGATGKEVKNNTYHMGENPVIDVELDATVTGYLSVIIVDVADQVYHLLPHQARTENELQSIGTVDGKTRNVRVAFPISEASLAKLGFEVVEPLGVNLLVGVVTPEPLFNDLRPRAESSAAFINAIQDRLLKLDEPNSFVTFQSLTTVP